MGEHIQKLGDALINENRFTLKILGLQIKQIKQEQQAKEKMYKLFLKLIDKDSAKKLMQIDLELSKAIREFEKRTGWTVKEHGVYLRYDLSSEENDYNSNSFFCIRRNNEYGFYLPQKQEKMSYSEQRKRCGEEEFFMQNYETLSHINDLFTQKENIVNGNYSFSDYEIDNSLIILITNYLGFQLTNNYSKPMNLRKTYQQEEL